MPFASKLLWSSGPQGTFSKPGLSGFEGCGWHLPGGVSGKEPAYQCRRLKRFGFDPCVGKIPWRRKWQTTPVFSLANSMDGGAWWATVHGVAKSRARLSKQWRLAGRGQGCCCTSFIPQDSPHDKELSGAKGQRCWGWEALLQNRILNLWGDHCHLCLSQH